MHYCLICVLSAVTPGLTSCCNVRAGLPQVAGPGAGTSAEPQWDYAMVWPSHRKSFLPRHYSRSNTF